MELDKTQIKLLLEKMHIYVQEDLYSSEERKLIKYKISHGRWIREIIYELNGVYLKIQPDRVDNRDCLNITLCAGGKELWGRWKFLAMPIFSPTWWKWKKITKLIRAYDNNAKAIREKMLFNETYARAFQDEIDGVLLGEEDVS